MPVRYPADFSRDLVDRFLDGRTVARSNDVFGIAKLVEKYPDIAREAARRRKIRTDAGRQSER
ncbi:MAG: hypothetical protein ABL908_07905 [Hyphomicrobium sp.]